MHADQVDLFQPPAEEAPRSTDLRTPEAWKITSSDAEYGWFVRTSWCGRFTIVHYAASANVVAFRRNVVGDRWNPPTVIGGYPTSREAAEACALYAERES